jgi:hypothetical protein
LRARLRRSGIVETEPVVLRSQIIIQPFKSTYQIVCCAAPALRGNSFPGDRYAWHRFADGVDWRALQRRFIAGICIDRLMWNAGRRCNSGARQGCYWDIPAEL